MNNLGSIIIREEQLHKKQKLNNIYGEIGIIVFSSSYRNKI